MAWVVVAPVIYVNTPEVSTDLTGLSKDIIS